MQTLVLRPGDKVKLEVHREGDDPVEFMLEIPAEGQDDDMGGAMVVYSLPMNSTNFSAFTAANVREELMFGEEYDNAEPWLPTQMLYGKYILIGHNEF